MEVSGSAARYDFQENWCKILFSDPTPKPVDPDELLYIFFLHYFSQIIYIVQIKMEMFHTKYTNVQTEITKCFIQYIQMFQRLLCFVLDI